VFAFLLAITLNLVSSSSCPGGWIDVGEICYKLENSLSLSWIKAQQHCQELGGHLAEPISEDTSNLLTSIANIETDVLGFPAWWLGLSDLAHEGRWIWQHSLDDVGYTNWAPDSPITDDVERNCVRMVAESDLKWVDESCTGTRASPICQIETSEASSSTLPPTTITTETSSTEGLVQVVLIGGDGSKTGNVMLLTVKVILALFAMTFGAQKKQVLFVGNLDGQAELLQFNPPLEMFLMTLPWIMLIVVEQKRPFKTVII